MTKLSTDSKERLRLMYEAQPLIPTKISDHTFVIRVPGGWLLNNYDKQKNLKVSLFVPFNNEFQGELEE